MSNRRPDAPQTPAALPDDHPAAKLALSDVELQQMEAFLAGCAGGEAMTLEELDGFLAAMAICPVGVPEREALAEIVGGNPERIAKFTDDEHRNTIFSLLRRHREAIGATLRADMPYFPLMLTMDDQAPTGHGWAMGFLRGVGLREDVWDVLIEDDDAGEALDPIILLADEAEPDPDEEPIVLSDEEREQLFRDIADALPEMYQWFEEQAQPKPRGGGGGRGPGGHHGGRPGQGGPRGGGGRRR